MLSSSKKHEFILRNHKEKWKKIVWKKNSKNENVCIFTQIQKNRIILKKKNWILYNVVFVWCSYCFWSLNGEIIVVEPKRMF